MNQLFWGLVPIERATAYYYYRKDAPSSKLIYHLKYYNRPQIGTYLGRCMAVELRSSSFFDGIDYLVPLPLHPHRLRHRGYNQSDYICRGIAAVTGIPIVHTFAVRKVDTQSQTHRGRQERRANVEHIFALVEEQGGGVSTRAFLRGKHLLLVDDVCTTGSTLTSLAHVFEEVEGIRISILTLTLAGRSM